MRRLKTRLADKGFQTRHVKTVPFDPTEGEQAAYERRYRHPAGSGRATGRESSATS